jgi:hypothetical protein
MVTQTRKHLLAALKLEGNSSVGFLISARTNIFYTDLDLVVSPLLSIYGVVELEIIKIESSFGLLYEWIG